MTINYVSGMFYMKGRAAMVGGMAIGKGDRWCILRTSGPRTVPLARALADAGFAAWTPTETRRVKTAGKLIDRDQPIMPTFVFASDAHVVDLLIAAQDPRCRFPAFSMFRRGDRVPLIGGGEMRALQEAEELARARHSDALAEEMAEVRRQDRIAELKRAAARRKALRAQPLEPMRIGTWIEVKDTPALAGLAGQIVEDRGNSAVVCFGGSLRMQIEAWQLIPVGVIAATADAA